MTTDYRALCAELVQAWDNTSDFDYNDFGNAAKPVVARARAALAQPEPVGPTPSDVTELFYRHMGEGSEVGFENAIAEALARWSRPALAPIPVSERLPGPGDCFPDDYGQRSHKCWAQQYHTDKKDQPLSTVLEAWDLVDYRLLKRCRNWYYAWLPATALPLPETK